MTEIKKVRRVAVCSGGGGRGAWIWRHLMELRRNGIEFDMISGTSTGCLFAFLYAKGLYDLAEELIIETYQNDARKIFKPGIAKIRGTGIKVDFWDTFTSLFKIKRVDSLMDNDRLYQVLLHLDKEYPGFKIPFFWNTVSLHTGERLQNSSDDFDRPEERCKSIVSSTSIPVLLPLRDSKGISRSYLKLGDGGITDGFPIKQTWARMLPNEPYEFYLFGCNPIDLLPEEELKNIGQIAGRTINIMLNEIMLNDISDVEVRNNISYHIWPVIEELEKSGQDNLAYILKTALGYRYTPIEKFIYDGTRGTLDFTPEALKDHNERAVKSVLERLPTLTKYVAA